MSSGRQSGYGMPPIARRQRDEDLVLFREMIKREKERTVSLLQPISVEFEPGEGNYRLYKIPSGKKEADFLAADGKNDYDWLKTPPGTPLFPSLDLEAEDPLLNLAVHKELPILQPIKPSRLSNHVHADRSKHSQRTKSPSTISTSGSSSTSITGSSSMSITPRLIKAEAHSIHRATNISSSLKSNDQRGNETIYNSETKQMPPRITTTTTTSTRQNFDRKLPPNCRPQIRSKLAQTVVEFTDETPKNLITETRLNNRRTSSTMRGRSMAMADERQQEGGRNIRRVSCSPISTMRGRKAMDLGMEYDGTKTKTVHNGNGNGNDNGNENAGVVMGSKMVERMMNARKTIRDHEKPKAVATTAGTGISGTTRFERTRFESSILKTSITLQEPDERKIESEGVARPANRLRSTTPTTNTVLKRESQRDEKKNENGVANVPRMKMRSSTPTSATVYTRECPRMNTTPDYETTRILRGRLNAESQIIVKKGNPRNRCGLC